MTALRLALAVLAGGVAAAQTRTVSAEPGGANLPVQRIGANDLIAVSVYDAPEFTRTLRVGPDGLIRLPMLKQALRAQGLLPAELERAISEALKSEQILVEPVVTVTVVEYHIRPISVAGAVRSPVTFQAMGGLTTLLEALTRAGGLAPEAGNEILVSWRQPGPEGAPIALTRRIPVQALIDQADPEANLRLQGGEEIRVPEVGKVFVIGNVRRPGAYAVENTSETSVLTMLAKAEGLAPYAAKEAYVIRRDDGGGRHELRVELRRILERKSPDVPLVTNDILYVPDSSGKRTAVSALEKIVGFGSATASGLLIWGSRR